MSNFSVGDYVYSSEGDEAVVIGIGSSPFGDVMYEVEYLNSYLVSGDSTEIMTEFDLTAAGNVENIDD